MQRHYLIIAYIIAASAAAAQIETAQQLLIAVAPDWNSPTATMYLFERGETSWTQYGTPWQVNLGDSGLAWGEGLHVNPAGGRLKQEGDHRSPAGVFELGDVFGYGDTLAVTVKCRYHRSTTTLRCVDDTGSVFYNSVVDEQDVMRDSLQRLPWTSSEPMIMDSVDYKYAIAVRQNPRAIPGKGSCVFLHVVRRSYPPTFGCTSMEEDQILLLMQWLDPEKRPLLVQLPIQEFRKYLVEWNLPLLSRN